MTSPRLVFLCKFLFTAAGEFASASPSGPALGQMESLQLRNGQRPPGKAEGRAVAGVCGREPPAPLSTQHVQLREVAGTQEMALGSRAS